MLSLLLPVDFSRNVSLKTQINTQATADAHAHSLSQQLKLVSKHRGKAAAGSATPHSTAALPVFRKVFVGTKYFSNTSAYHDRTISITSSKTTGR